IVLRDGLIEAVGAKVNIPADAVEIDASGKTIYPGLIDVYTHLGLQRPQTTAAAGGTRTQGAPAMPSTPGMPSIPGPSFLPGFGQRRETPPGAIHPLSRVRPETQARNLIAPFDGENNEAERYRHLGITTVLTAPESGIFRGESALINLKD